MTTYGRAAAPGAGTVVNALATGRGSAFALDFETVATVELDPQASSVTGEIAGQPDGDTTLVETCVRRVVEGYGDGQGGRVRTESAVPTAAGLKSSSAAANATVLATLAALEVPVGPDGVDRLDACRLGVEAAREAGVTVTGAFDDASASMLGGVTITDNTDDSLLAHESFSHDAVVWTPPERAYSADTSVERCERVAPMARLAIELARDGRYGEAMTVNGLAYAATLGYPVEPAAESMAHVTGVSLSGTGPSVVAVGGDTTRVAELWAERPGTVRQPAARDEGARVVDRGAGPAPNLE